MLFRSELLQRAEMALLTRLPNECDWAYMALAELALGGFELAKVDGMDGWGCGAVGLWGCGAVGLWGCGADGWLIAVAVGLWG